ncbi:MAG: RICIN domain-containing protein [Clostridiales bacterium]|jgi:hypothetical protein|nr:RICIN domain-containing protein [Clostridiales bacterium]
MKRNANKILSLLLSLVLLIGLLPASLIIKSKAAESSPIPDGVYFIKSAMDGRYMDVCGGLDVNQTQVQIYGFNGSPAQQWQVTSSTDGTVRLHSMATTDKMLDIPGANPANFTDVEIYQNLNNVNQQFKIVSQGNNQYSIRTACTNYESALDVAGGTVGTGMLDQYQYTGGSNQLWSFESVNQGQNVPSNQGLDITNKNDLVSICYSTWFDPIVNGGPIYSIADALAGRAAWGPWGAFHFWGEPALGYYRSDDTNVIRTHMTELSEAGVDFIIIDNTNASVSWKQTDSWNQMISQPVTALLNTIKAMRSEGKTTPYVVFWNRTDTDPSSQDYDGVTWAMYNEFMASGQYADLFVYWNGKPLVLTTNDVPPSLNSTFTARKMWGLQGSLGTSEWSFLQKYPQNVSFDASGSKEQMVVCTALQQSYMTNSDAIGRRGGYTFWEEWTAAFNNRPKIVTLTWWNEWAAQRFDDGNGNSMFVDNYTEEYSRDIEPMMGGHGDKYYQWMKQYIAAYKNHQECPKLTDDNTQAQSTLPATGVVDEISGQNGGVYLRGWAYDPNSSGTSIEIHVYIGGDASVAGVDGKNTGATSGYRPDVNNAFGITGNHGFDMTVSTSKQGNQRVVVYAISATGQGPQIIYDGTVNIT